MVDPCTSPAHGRLMGTCALTHSPLRTLHSPLPTPHSALPAPFYFPGVIQRSPFPPLNLTLPLTFPCLLAMLPMRLQHVNSRRPLLSVVVPSAPSCLRPPPPLKYGVGRFHLPPAPRAAAAHLYTQLHQELHMAPSPTAQAHTACPPPLSLSHTHTNSFSLSLQLPKFGQTSRSHEDVMTMDRQRCLLMNLATSSSMINDGPPTDEAPVIRAPMGKSSLPRPNLIPPRRR